MKLAALLTACCCASSWASYAAYSASLTSLSGGTAKGEVTIFVTPTGLTGVGSATGLEPDLKSKASSGTNCNATNGCGVHVHSGTACTDKETQGGHYFGGSVDPWKDIHYSSSDADGSTHFHFSVTDSANDIASKPFIIHNNAGGRVACGILTEVTKEARACAVLDPLNEGKVRGEVTIFTTATAMIGAGHASDLEANLQTVAVGGKDCTAKNACGVHVHSGTACTTTDTQGGHYFSGAADPWTTIQYQTTTAAGAAEFVFSVANVGSNVTNKPFIIHNNAGGRVSCGLLTSTSCAPAANPAGGSSAQSTTSTQTSSAAGLASCLWFLFAIAHISALVGS